MFLNKLLVAVDDSLPSQYAIDVGLVIAQRDGCPVTFCVVLDPALLAKNYGFESMCQLAEQLANDLLKSALRRAADAGVNASTNILYHDAAQGIIDFAAAENVGMIAMGTHGRSGLSRALTRSVAEEVLRRTTTPLCVIRRPKIGKIYYRFLVPLVNDELSAAARNYAVDLARQFESSLLFCTVADSKPESVDFLKTAQHYAEDRGVRAETIVLQPGPGICEQIVQNAVTADCDAIVMASHARDGFLRMVEGSVAEAVIRTSELPVVVIR